MREALEASDGVVLVVPEPGASKANKAFFEAGAARALGKPVVAVLPSPDPGRAGELPSACMASPFSTDRAAHLKSLANSIVTALKAA